MVKNLKTFHATAEKMDMAIIKKQAENFNATEPYLKALDTMHIFIFIVNSYRQIVYANKTYLDFLNIKDITYILGQRPGENVGCVNAFKNEGGCGTSTACRNCSAGNLLLKSISENQSLADESSIIIKRNGFDTTLNLFEKIAPLEINNEIFYLVSFSDATDSVIRRSMEKVFFHDVINTAGALKALLNLLKTEVPKIHENEVAQVEGLFDGLIDEIQSQKQILSAENKELYTEIEEFNSTEVLFALKKLYHGYSNSINRTIKIDKDSISIDLRNDITLLKRVVGNMLKNALEATDYNGIVTIGCHIALNKHIQFYVRNPCYIRAEIQDSIFEKAFSTKGKYRGLGTYSMKLLGEGYLKGSVGFTSTKADGTCFYIEIPQNKLL